MSQWKEIVKNIEEDVRRRLTITPKWSHQINMKISACPDRVSIAQCSENWHVKPDDLSSILGWGSQVAFRNRQRFGLIRTSFSILNLYIIERKRLSKSRKQLFIQLSCCCIVKNNDSCDCKLFIKMITDNAWWSVAVCNWEKKKKIEG